MIKLKMKCSFCKKLTRNELIVREGNKDTHIVPICSECVKKLIYLCPDEAKEN